MKQNRTNNMDKEEEEEDKEKDKTDSQLPKQIKRVSLSLGELMRGVSCTAAH